MKGCSLATCGLNNRWRQGRPVVVGAQETHQDEPGTQRAALLAWPVLQAAPPIGMPAPRLPAIGTVNLNRDLIWAANINVLTWAINANQRRVVG